MLTAVAGLVAGADSSRAVQPPDMLAFKLGPVLIRPRVQVSEQYDSNIYYRDRDVVDDLITRVSPGVNFYVGRPEENHISLTYTLDSPFYAKNDQLDNLNHTFTLEPRWHGARLDVHGTDSFQVLNSVLGGIYLVAANQSLERNVTANDYTVQYRISPKTLVYARGAYNATDWASGTYLQDYNTLTGTGGFGFQALPKVVFFGEGYYGQTATNPNRPSNTNDVFSMKGPHMTFTGAYLGARGDFTPKLTGEVKVGYEFREFSNGAEVPGGLVAGVSLTHRLNERTTTRLSYLRQSVVSVEYNAQTYDLDAINLQFSRAFGAAGKWTANATGSVGSYTYSGNVFANRQDFLYTWGLGLSYAIQEWMKAGFAYDFTKFESNYPGAVDYDVHRVMLQLTVGY